MHTLIFRSSCKTHIEKCDAIEPSIPHCINISVAVNCLISIFRIVRGDEKRETSGIPIIVGIARHTLNNRN